MLQNGDKLDW